MISELWNSLLLLHGKVVMSKFELEPFRDEELRDTTGPRSHSIDTNAWLSIK